jgi:hypothetical protein
MDKQNSFPFIDSESCLFFLEVLGSYMKITKYEGFGKTPEMMQHTIKMDLFVKLTQLEEDML